MDGPWVKYQQQAAPAEEGPWTKYGAAPKADPSMGKLEATLRGAVYGAAQQPRDVIAAGIAAGSPNITFEDALNDARSLSLEGKQGQAQQERPGYFGGGQIAGNIATTLLPATAATKAISATAPLLSKAPIVGRALEKLATGIGASKGLVGVPAAGAIQGGISTLATQGDLSGAGPGAIGAGAMGALGKVARPIAKEGISKARQGYVDLLKKSGIKNLSPAQLTGNATLKNIESVLANLPFTAGPARKKAEQQLQQFTKAALAFAGAKGDDVTPEARAAIEATFRQRYGDLVNNEIVTIDKPALMALSDVESKNLNKLPTNIRPIVESYLSDIVSSGGKLSGQAYQTTRSQLSSQAKSMSTSDPFTASVLRDIRNTLDAAAERSLPTAKKGMWREVNKQYANYKAIQKAASGPSKDALEGVLSPSALNTAVETANKTKGQAGYGELYPLARAGKSVLVDDVPNSGTAQRLLIQQLVTGGGIGVGSAGATYGATKDPETALLAGAAALGGPRALQALLHSRAAQGYFTSGVPGLNLAAHPLAKSLAALLGGQLGAEEAD